jgi:hypothetical protein
MKPNRAKIYKEYCENFALTVSGTVFEFKKTVNPNIVFNWIFDKLLPKTRSLSQNRALHLYYDLISQQLNDAGYEREVQVVNEIVNVKYTPEYIKEFWRTVQLYMFDIKSTRDINTNQINQIIDVFSKHFGQKGIYVEFPSFESFMNKLDSISFK